jgi:ribulose kinase
LIKDEASLKALELVELWLKDESKVSNRRVMECRQCRLHTAANATSHAAAYAAYAAYAYAANAAARAAAYAAANAAANAGDYDTKIRKYYELAEAMTRDLTNLERLCLT